MSNIEQLERWDRDSFFHPSTHLAEFARKLHEAQLRFQHATHLLGAPR